MHRVIRAIVYAQNKDEALSKAKGVFEGLCEDRIFDYHTTFDTAGSSMSGRGRWGNITPIARVDSEKGKKLVDEGMEATKQEFLKNIKIIRAVLKKKTNTELFQNDYDKKMFRHRCYVLGQYRGYSVWLYDNDGTGIRTPSHLKNVLNKWACLDKEGKENPYKGLNVYVVPADVHF